MLQQTRVAIGLGSSKGDRLEFLRQAFARLREDLFLDDPVPSAVFETPPWGGVAQGQFLNAAVVGLSDWKPPAILNYLKQLEQDLGRQQRERNADREIDLDLLFYGDVLWTSEGIEVPHPALAEREFVLLPLAQIAPDWKHPLLKKSVLDLLVEWQTSHTSTAKVFPQSL